MSLSRRFSVFQVRRSLFLAFLIVACGVASPCAFALDQGEAYQCAIDKANAPTVGADSEIANRRAELSGSSYRAKYDWRSKRGSGWTAWATSDVGGCSFASLCTARSEQTGWKGGGDNGLGSVCHDGCAYDGSVYAGSPTGRLFTANGEVCKNSDLPAPETPVPGDGDGGGGGEIPGDGDGGGDGGSNPGTGPGNGGGDGGGGNGDGDGDGEGDGDGNGSGPGTGPGDGDGDGDGDGEGSTLPEGEMWKAPKDTMQSVFDEFYDKAKKTKAVDGITNFLKVSGGGSCPTFTLPASMFWRSMTYSAHCSGDFLAMLQLCGFVIFAFAAYAAVRISLT